MHLLRQSTNELITLDAKSRFNQGGEARLFKLAQRRGAMLAAKIYDQPTPARTAKLATMLANPPEDPMASQNHVSIAWPIDLLLAPDGSRQVLGFLMPLVDGCHPVIDFYNPKTRAQQHPLSNYRYLIRTARNIAAAFQALHARNYVIGDVNESNILVAETALATLVDTDSFQVPETGSRVTHRCPVGKLEFTPPELQGAHFGGVDRTPEHDRFGLAVLIFQLLMEGTHPFSSRFTGQGEAPQLDDCIKSGAFPYQHPRAGAFEPKPFAPPFTILAPNLQALFVRCFVDGHRRPSARPDAQTWVRALTDAESELTVCSAHDEHIYVRHLTTCPWCERRTLLRGIDPFPSRQAVQAKQHALPPPLPRSPYRVPSRAAPLPVVARGVSWIAQRWRSLSAITRANLITAAAILIGSLIHMPWTSPWLLFSLVLAWRCDIRPRPLRLLLPIVSFVAWMLAAWSNYSFDPINLIPSFMSTGTFVLALSLIARQVPSLRALAKLGGMAAVGVIVPFLLMKVTGSYSDQMLSSVWQIIVGCACVTFCNGQMKQTGGLFHKASTVNKFVVTILFFVWLLEAGSILTQQGVGLIRSAQETPSEAALTAAPEADSVPLSPPDITPSRTHSPWGQFQSDLPPWSTITNKIANTSSTAPNALVQAFPPAPLPAVSKEPISAADDVKPLFVPRRGAGWSWPIEDAAVYRFGRPNEGFEPRRFQAPKTVLGGLEFQRTAEVLTKSLSFYPGYSFLYIVDPTSGRKMPIFMLLNESDPAESVHLNLGNTAVYSFNEELPIRLDTDTVKDYIMFFFSVVRAKHGRFLPVQTANDIRWLPDADAVKRKAESVISPIRLLSNDSSAAFHAEVCMVFKDSLFRTEAFVTSKGLITLKNEKLLIENLPVVFDALEPEPLTP